jgi:Spy/CpxP family protein refolding chaperone
MELYQTLGKETEDKIAKVLLPHQKKRLGQIMLQMKLSQTSYGYGFAGALEGDDVGKELGITDAQREELKKKEEKIRGEFMKKYQDFYKKLNDETKEELMSVLTPSQRKKLEDLLGNKFELQQPQFSQPATKTEKKGD